MSSLHSQQVPRGAPRDTGLPSCSPHNARNGRRVSPGSTLARTLKCGLKFLMGLVGLRKTSVDSPASGWRRVLAGVRRFLPLPRPAPESRPQTRPGQGRASEEVAGRASSREACGSGRVWRVPAASRSHWVAGQSGHTRPLRSRTVVTCRLRPCRRSGLRRSGLDVHMQISQSRVSCFEVLNLCPPVDTILLIRGTFLPFAWCFVCVASSGERTGSPTAGRNRRDARSRAGNSALPSCVSMCLSRGQ